MENEKIKSTKQLKANMTEFNLSEKTTEVRNIDGIRFRNMFFEEDVKEFIRLLKEEIANQEILKDDVYFISDGRVNEIIDKLAGEKLK